MTDDSAHERSWAYGFDKPPAPGDTAVPQRPPTRALRHGEDSAKQTRLRQLNGSRAAYSLVDIRDGHNAVDWFPEDHPPMPPIVAHGPTALGARGRGCGFCHLPNGKGRPENASLAGLPVPYFIRQIQDFRSGRRRSADPRKANTNTMIELARTVTNQEIKAAAVRQLWDIRQGTRTGIAAQAMKPVLANLTGDDLVAIAAYVSSRQGQ